MNFVNCERDVSSLKQWFGGVIKPEAKENFQIGTVT